MKSTAGDLKRALARVPDDVLVIIPQDSDDGGRADEAYWDGDESFAHHVLVYDDDLPMGHEWREVPWDGDPVLFLNPGEEYRRPANPPVRYQVEFAFPARNGLTGEPVWMWASSGSKNTRTAADQLFDEVRTRHPGAPARMRDQVQGVIVRATFLPGEEMPRS